MSAVVFVCGGESMPGGLGWQECWNCGGWVHADGCVPKGERAIADHYCSEDCHDEALTFAERNKRVDDWCPACGFDNFEHADDCAPVEPPQGDAQ